MITINNFHIHTRAIFKGCSLPKRKPDYVSRRSGSRVKSGSLYWYGCDKKGQYVIRSSDHWVDYKGFNKEPKVKGIKSVASCIWSIKTNSSSIAVTGKAYLSDFTRISTGK